MSFGSQVRDLLKLLGACALVAVLLLILGMNLLLPHRSPPRETQVIRNFEAHRAAFERLRDMLLQDKQLVRLANWGVTTLATPVASKPPAGDFPLDRYNQYTSLLNEVGAVGAHRDKSDPLLDVCVWVYASGWAGDTRHLDLCWENQTPANQVSSLDDFYKTPKPRKSVFRHVDANWYLWADW